MPIGWWRCASSHTHTIDSLKFKWALKLISINCTQNSSQRPCDKVVVLFPGPYSIANRVFTSCYAHTLSTIATKSFFFSEDSNSILTVSLSENISFIFEKFRLGRRCHPPADLVVGSRTFYLLCPSRVCRVKEQRPNLRRLDLCGGGGGGGPRIVVRWLGIYAILRLTSTHISNSNASIIFFLTHETMMQPASTLRDKLLLPDSFQWMIVMIRTTHGLLWKFLSAERMLLFLYYTHTAACLIKVSNHLY